jgi:uncharacterized protein related to proFAR isomerase
MTLFLAELTMQIIPVVDVRFGQVVRAEAGQREQYAPLKSLLATSTNPADVARGYLTLYPFPIVYAADLDGIEGRGTQAQLGAQLAAACPGADIWIDDGTHAFADISLRLKQPQRHAVIGSEMLTSALALEGPMAMFGPRIVLSLDFGSEGFRGPIALLDDASRWPKSVIVMTLAKVGGNAGPDVRRLREIARRASPGTRVFAAGGVRNLDDLRALRDAGAAGALIASALHTGQIKTGGLEEAAGW